MLTITRCFILFDHLRLILVKHLRGWARRLMPVQGPSGYGRRRASADSTIGSRSLNAPKPAWVHRELIRMKARMPQAGCRSLAMAFNRRFSTTRRMTVGKSFVAETLRRHAYDVQVAKRGLKQRPPRAVPWQRVWGLDLTGKSDRRGHTYFILGIVEHASRANIALTVLKDKSAITLLELLIQAVKTYGKPRYIRTDNEPLFQARWLQIGLWLLDIRHQTTQPGCPWMNGRIERFFGTLKNKLNRWEVASGEQLETALGLFRLWYNHVRPHQHLQGRTPAEVWQGIDCYATPPRQCDYFSAWDGLLTGYYLRY